MDAMTVLRRGEEARAAPNGTIGLRDWDGEPSTSGFQPGGPAGHGPPVAERVIAWISPALSTESTPSSPTVGGATPVVAVLVEYFQRSRPVASNGRPVAETPTDAAPPEWITQIV
jgi:hypothetical protein